MGEQNKQTRNKQKTKRVEEDQTESKQMSGRTGKSRRGG